MLMLNMLKLNMLMFNLMLTAAVRSGQCGRLDDFVSDVQLLLPWKVVVTMETLSLQYVPAC